MMSDAIDNPDKKTDPEEIKYKVVVNDEEQYSIWPLESKVPLGWKELPESGSRDECLSYIKRVWTDMRPLSIRS
ncbi:MbtH family NRPS accessory protein [Desulfobacter postgatei]|uniref:MbtH family protein n=1 Tax=Desulfobacter postgatei TaxID=2293 RepID=UPI00259B4C59|nr:MbtH family NRPS accessory protein [uncultured Desulfobacter sp.]